jgi:hypothetical protein
MFAYCGRPAAAYVRDLFPYIDPRYARKKIPDICSLAGALATANIAHTGSVSLVRLYILYDRIATTR